MHASGRGDCLAGVELPARNDVRGRTPPLRSAVTGRVQRMIPGFSNIMCDKFEGDRVDQSGEEVAPAP
jgi:hypothetical protein